MYRVHYDHTVANEWTSANTTPKLTNHASGTSSGQGEGGPFAWGKGAFVAANEKDGKEVAEEEEEDDDEGIDLSWPDDKLGQVYYVVACPIMYLLAYTIPNCKKQRHLFGVVFLESIFYIGFFSYFMVG